MSPKVFARDGYKDSGRQRVNHRDGFVRPGGHYGGFGGRTWFICGCLEGGVGGPNGETPEECRTEISEASHG